MPVKGPSMKRGFFFGLGLFFAFCTLVSFAHVIGFAKNPAHAGKFDAVDLLILLLAIVERDARGTAIALVVCILLTALSIYAARSIPRNRSWLPKIAGFFLAYPVAFAVIYALAAITAWMRA
jgi:hypothetical protein